MMVPVRARTGVPAARRREPIVYAIARNDTMAQRIAGWVHGRLYYYPYNNGCETLPAEEDHARKHPVHTISMTQHATQTQAARDESQKSLDDTDVEPTGQRLLIIHVWPCAQGLVSVQHMLWLTVAGTSTLRRRDGSPASRAAV